MQPIYYKFILITLLADDNYYHPFLLIPYTKTYCWLCQYFIRNLNATINLDVVKTCSVKHIFNIAFIITLFKETHYDKT